MTTHNVSVFRILSWNVQGLNSKFKRAILFRYLKLHSPHMVLLQETHLRGSKCLALKKPWIQQAFHSSYSTYARGISILISNYLPCIMEQVYTDPQGKYVIIVFTVWGTRYIVVGVYIPPSFSSSTLYSILEKVISYYPAKLLLMGDFNAIMAPDLDRPVPPKQYSTDLFTWAQIMGITEVWRWKHPETRAYSCFSAT